MQRTQPLYGTGFRESEDYQEIAKELADLAELIGAKFVPFNHSKDDGCRTKDDAEPSQKNKREEADA